MFHFSRYSIAITAKIARLCNYGHDNATEIVRIQKIDSTVQLFKIQFEQYIPEKADKWLELRFNVLQ